MQIHRHLFTAASLAALLALAACGERAEEPGQPQATGPVSEQSEVTATRSPSESEGQQGPSVDTSAMGAAGESMTMNPEAGDGDAEITAKVKSTLAADPDLGALKIDVDTQSGVVTLRGTAPDPQAKERAAQLVKNMQEVKSVDNQLTLG